MKAIPKCGTLSKFYMDAMTKARLTGMRYGSAVLHHLAETRPDLVKAIVRTDRDPYGMNGPADNFTKWDAFASYIEQHWYEEAPQRPNNGSIMVASDDDHVFRREHVPQTEVQRKISILSFHSKGLPPGTICIFGGRQIQGMDLQPRDCLIINWMDQNPMDPKLPKVSRTAYFALNELGTKWEYISEYVPSIE